jgi:hypothetical protein
MTDFQVEDHGSIRLLRPLTDAARAWIDTHLSHPETQRLGEAVAIEPRYVDAIVSGIVSDGLTVEGV